jgi:ABC-type Fe3+/spermidine/putrescine transport system ATPase subunit
VRDAAYDHNIGRIRAMVQARNVTVADGAPDGQAPLALRPERIMLGDAQEKRLAGDVAEAIFLGDQTRLRVTLGDGAALTVRLPHAEGEAAPSMGDRISLSFSRQAGRLLPPA